MLKPKTSSHFTIILKRMLTYARYSRNSAKIFLTVSLPKEYASWLPRIIEYIRRYIDENALGIYSETTTNKHWHGFITTMYLNEALPIINKIRKTFQEKLGLKSLNIYAKHISFFKFHNYFYKNLTEALAFHPDIPTPKQIFSIPQPIYTVLSDTTAWFLYLIDRGFGYSFFKWLIQNVWLEEEDTPQHKRAKQLYNYAMTVHKKKFILWLKNMFHKARATDTKWFNGFMNLLSMIRPHLHDFVSQLLKKFTPKFKNKRKRYPNKRKSTEEMLKNCNKGENFSP